MAEGKRIRERVPRSSHAGWVAAKSRRNPIELLKAADEGRMRELLPIRYARMRQSPFAFLRGAAAVMAADLASTPATGIRVQACGDCHVANFGGFATPERRLVFDINDFDETLPAPWEWDVKRLAASVVLALREAGFGERHSREVSRKSAEAYRTRMHEYAAMTAVEVWYSHLDLNILRTAAKTGAAKRKWQRLIEKATRTDSGHEFPKLTSLRGERPRILDHPPLITHPPDVAKITKRIRRLFERYRQTLTNERRIVFDRYELVDVARKIVGVGSVGTHCAVALLMAGPEDPLVLQFKEARRSVLEPYAGPSRYENQGERVVIGQRMLQSASDVFLGWTHDDLGRDFYFRQLRDMKMKIDLESMSELDWIEYAELCGWALARGHARTGDPARIAGYLGKKPTFDAAIEKFAAAYADQTESDYEIFLKAVRRGQFRCES